MTLPNFLIIGAQKSGTTSLYNYLKQHPKIYMSPLKEPHFFSYGLSGNPAQGFSEFYGRLKSPITNLQDYQSLFQKSTDEIAIGEASTSYLYHINAPERIHNYLPNVRLIAILRNPVQIVYSKFLMDCRNRQQFDQLSHPYSAVRRRSLQVTVGQNKLIDLFEQELQKYSLRQGNEIYSKMLKRYFHLFAREQIKIYLFDDLKANYKNLIRDCLQFLNVDSDFCPEQSIVYNSGGIPKNKNLYISLEKMREIFNITFKPILPKFLLQHIYRSYISLRSYYLIKPPSLPLEMRQRLIEILRYDILQLQDLLQRDLSEWLIYESLDEVENSKDEVI